MFTEAEILLLENGRSIVAIPTALPDDSTIDMVCKDDTISFIAQGKIIGKLAKVDPTYIAYFLSQSEQKIGLIATPEGQTSPNHITHIANLKSQKMRP